MTIAFYEDPFFSDVRKAKTAFNGKGIRSDLLKNHGKAWFYLSESKEEFFWRGLTGLELAASAVTGP
jgi:hypothetical protein